MKNSRTEKDIVRLKHILKAIGLIRDFISDSDIDEFEKSELLQSAVIRQLEIIGEASVNLSDDLKSEQESIPWNDFRKFRNTLIHEYFRIDIYQAWQTAKFELPNLEEEIRGVLEYYIDEEE
jgi:uncharacterized protein with HEPN domain